MQKKGFARPEGILVKRDMKGKITYRDIKGITHHANPDSVVTQTFLLSKERFTKQEAIDWLKKYGKIHEIDEGRNFWRARQVSPGKFRKDVKFSTFQIEHGILDVGGKLKQ